LRSSALFDFADAGFPEFPGARHLRIERRGRLGGFFRREESDRAEASGLGLQARVYFRIDDAIDGLGEWNCPRRRSRDRASGPQAYPQAPSVPLAMTTPGVSQCCAN